MDEREIKAPAKRRRRTKEDEKQFETEFKSGANIRKHSLEVESLNYTKNEFSMQTDTLAGI